MDKLTRSLLGKYRCTIHLHNEISLAAVIALKSQVDLEDIIKQTMASQLAKKLIEDKPAAFFTSTDSGDHIVFSAKLIAMTEQDADALVQAAYQAGMDSKNT